MLPFVAPLIEDTFWLVVGPVMGTRVLSSMVEGSVEDIEDDARPKFVYPAAMLVRAGP